MCTFQYNAFAAREGARSSGRAVARDQDSLNLSGHVAVPGYDLLMGSQTRVLYPVEATANKNLVVGLRQVAPKIDLHPCKHELRRGVRIVKQTCHPLVAHLFQVCQADGVANPAGNIEVAPSDLDPLFMHVRTITVRPGAPEGMSFKQ